MLSLRAEIGVPHTLVALGAPLDQADRIVEMAVVDPTAGGNPIALTGRPRAEIFDAAAANRRLRRRDLTSTRAALAPHALRRDPEESEIRPPPVRAERR